MSFTYLLLDAGAWSWIIVIAVMVVGGYFFLDRVMRKGIYDESRAGSGMVGRAGNALSELQTLVDPARRHVIEEKLERKRAEHDDAGDDPEPSASVWCVYKKLSR